MKDRSGQVRSGMHCLRRSPLVFSSLFLLQQSRVSVLTYVQYLWSFFLADIHLYTFLSLSSDRKK